MKYKKIGTGYATEPFKKNTIKLHLFDVVSEVVGDASGAEITAHYLYEQNQLTPPTVSVGETFEVYGVEGSDILYCKLFTYEKDLRNQERVVFVVSNKSPEDKILNSSNSHYIIFDAIAGVMHLHTSDNQGEACTFDISLDMKNGKVNYKDSEGTKINVDVKKKKITTDTDEIEYNVKKMVINADSYELNAKTSKVGGGAHTIESTLTLKGATNVAAAILFNGNGNTMPAPGPGPHPHVLL